MDRHGSAARRYHLYYSVSSFGSRDSAIGLATNVTLDPESPDYTWIDQGMVIRSFADRDDWNAIDPNIVIEDDDTPMTEGGGTLVLEATAPTWRGPGHNGFLRDGDEDYLAFHAYPAEGRGSRLFMSTVVWENGWPRVAALP